MAIADRLRHLLSIGRHLPQGRAPQVPRADGAWQRDQLGRAPRRGRGDLDGPAGPRGGKGRPGRHPLREPARVGHRRPRHPVRGRRRTCRSTRRSPPPRSRYILNDSRGEGRLRLDRGPGGEGRRDPGRALRHLQHVVRFDPTASPGTMSLDELRAKGREALAADPDAVRRRAAEVSRRRPRHPHLHLGHHRRPQGGDAHPRQPRLQRPRRGEGLPDARTRRTSRSSFLPLCHSFERTAGHNFMLHAGRHHRLRRERREGAREHAARCGPHVMCSVPRLYEKMYARVNEKVAADPPLRQKIFHWAIGVGREVFAHTRGAHRRPGPLLKLQVRARRQARLLEDQGAHRRPAPALRLRRRAPRPGDRRVLRRRGAARSARATGSPRRARSSPATAPTACKPGTVGLPLDGVEVKIAEDGEILTRGPHVMKGYFNKPEATAEAIDADGWFHTGDIGLLDPDGFLVITDRKKDIIVTSGRQEHRPPADREPPQDQPVLRRGGDDRQQAQLPRRAGGAELRGPRGLGEARTASPRPSREELVARPEVVQPLPGPHRPS